MSKVIYRAKLCSLPSLLQDTIKYWFTTLKFNFIYIVLIPLLAGLASDWIPLKSRFNWSWIVIVLVILIELYLIALGLLKTHAIFSGKIPKRKTLVEQLHTRLPSIYMGFFAWVLMLCIISLICLFLNKIIHQGVFIVWAVNLMSFFIIIVLVGFFVLTLLGLPLIILGIEPRLRAFSSSAKLIGKHFFWTFLLYGLIALFVLWIYPNTYHAHWFGQHHLKIIFDIVGAFIFFPLIFNYTLFFLNYLFLKMKGHSLTEIHFS